MYSINSIPLNNNPTYGWKIMRSGTTAFAGITRERTEVRVPGYDGYFKGPSTRDAKTIVFRVLTAQDALEPLLALVDTQNGLLSRTDSPTREAPFELSSATIDGERPNDTHLYVTITLVVPGAAWRSITPEVTGPVAIANPSQTIDLLNGISAPIRDMDVFVGGVFGEFRLTDSSGAWLKTTQAWAGSATTGILFVGLTGQAFLANTAAPWTPISDVSEQVDVSGGGGFKITPLLNAGDPGDRHGRLVLTTLTQTNVALSVRARNAHAIQ